MTGTDNLILDSLEISNFRAFKHLQIDRLSRVNLIVGQNNIGKTCLLEALWLYANYGNPEGIKWVLENRKEWVSTNDKLSREAILKHIFYGHASLKENQTQSIRIGPNDNNHALYIKLENSDRRVLDSLFYKSQSIQRNGDTDEQLTKFTIQLAGDYPDSFKKLTTTMLNASNFQNEIPLQYQGYCKELFLVGMEGQARLFTTTLKPLYDDVSKSLPHEFITTSGIQPEKTTALWEKTYLTDAEQSVTDALSLIEADIQQIGLVGNLPKIKFPKSKTPIMLSSLGEGMNRIFGLALALVNLENGILLVDEIENGLYYGIQPKVWSFIFDIAEQLNVQVFATTHSWDMIRAFQKALHERDKDDGLLISLWPKVDHPGEVVGVMSNQDELDISVEYGIEVR